MNNNNYVVIGPGNAITNNSTRNKARNLLRNSVNPEFFNNAWNTRNKAMNYSMWNHNGEFVGFALLKIKRNKINKKLGLYIDLISAKRGKGSVLLKHIINNWKNDEDIKFLNLSSVPQAVEFYRRHGFKITKRSGPMTSMKLEFGLKK